MLFAPSVLTDDASCNPEPLHVPQHGALQRLIHSLHLHDMLSHVRISRRNMLSYTSSCTLAPEQMEFIYFKGSCIYRTS